jgi:hypothetical protein
MTGVAASEASYHRPDTRFSRQALMQAARQLLEA